jgi:hypothetical protein
MCDRDGALLVPAAEAGQPCRQTLIADHSRISASATRVARVGLLRGKISLFARCSRVVTVTY